MSDGREDEVSTGAGPVAASPSLRRAFVVYTALRVGLFTGLLLALALVGLRGIVLLAAAFVPSALLSLLLFGRQRDALSTALAARTERSRRRRTRAADTSYAGDGDAPPTSPS